MRALKRVQRMRELVTRMREIMRKFQSQNVVKCSCTNCEMGFRNNRVDTFLSSLDWMSFKLIFYKYGITNNQNVIR